MSSCQSSELRDKLGSTCPGWSASTPSISLSTGVSALASALPEPTGRDEARVKRQGGDRVPCSRAMLRQGPGSLQCPLGTHCQRRHQGARDPAQDITRSLVREGPGSLHGHLALLRPTAPAAHWPEPGKFPPLGNTHLSQQGPALVGAISHSPEHLTPTSAFEGLGGPWCSVHPGACGWNPS